MDVTDSNAFGAGSYWPYRLTAEADGERTRIDLHIHRVPTTFNGRLTEPLLRLLAASTSAGTCAAPSSGSNISPRRKMCSDDRSVADPGPRWFEDFQCQPAGPAARTIQRRIPVPAPTHPGPFLKRLD
ncbi:hypothetical protein AB0J35_61825 [Nonomuraea angiospora]|uniref:hypothetical protein n=1 Tax=Nonomuraea angiospora TaxID=46172 RepID=UPI00343B89D0